MKKTFILAAIAAAVCLWSCAKTEEKPLPSEAEETPADATEAAVPEGFKIITIEATRSAVNPADENGSDGAQNAPVGVAPSPDAPVSKTSYADEKYFSWTAGDQISVLCNNGAENFWQTFTAQTSAAVSRFTATVADNVEMGPLDGVSRKVALFPASAGHVYTSDSEISFNIPAEKDFRSASGGHTSADVPMFAWGDSDDNYAFANIAGAVKFSFSGVPTSTAKLEFTNTCSLKLNGTYALSLNADATNVAWSATSTETTSEKTVTMYGDVSEGNVSFYVPYATGTLWAWNVLTLSDPESGTVFYNNTHVGQIAVTKNSIAVTPTLPAVVPSFVSAYGIDWSGISASENANATYPAITKLKATGDEDYLYLYMEVDASALVKTDAYDHYFHIYVSDGSGSTKYWGAATCSDIGGNAWAVVGGNQAFTNWKSAFSSNLLDSFGTWYYEVRIERSFNSILAAGGEVGVAVVLDDVYSDGSNYANLNSHTPYGIIPTRGTDMYTVNFPASTSSLTLSFTEASEDYLNPERGLYNQQSFHFRNGEIPSASLWDNDESLVLPLFYFEDFRDSDLSQAVLDRIEDVFDNIRAEGKKAIVRFGYINDHSNGAKPWDAGITQIRRHIAQVRDILQANEDIIYVMQAGFVGVFGEWYYVSDDFVYSTSGSSVVDYENRALVISDLLAAVPNRQVSLRAAKYKRFYLNPTAISSWTPISSWGTSDNDRLGFFNDGFRGSSDDIGTFETQTDRDMWNSQSAWVITGGEAAYRGGDTQEEHETWLAANPDLADFDNSLAAIREQHFSYLNENPNNILMDFWDGDTQGIVGSGSSRIPELRKALGYRLKLNTVDLGFPDLNSGSTVTYSISMSNVGSAPVIYPRPFKLVLLHGGTPTVLVADLGEIRNVAPAGSETFSGSFSLPQNVVAGDKLAIWLPDNAASLQSNAAYSIRLANSDVTWSSGYNVIHTF